MAAVPTATVRAPRARFSASSWRLPPASPGILVAVVASDPLLRSGLAERLDAEPELRVAGVAGAAGAIDRLVEAHEAAVVVLEVGRAAGAAREVLELRARRPLARVVVLLGPGEVDLDAVVRAGASGLVLHSASVGELVTALRWAARGEMWVSPPLLARLVRAARHEDGGGRPPGRLAQLTRREFEMLRLLSHGCDNREVARRLFLSLNTVRTHARNIQRKLGVHSNLAAVAVAFAEGLRPVEAANGDLVLRRTT
ncbi:MAG TPA: response regulator transcription factor [Acidimicrobiales bacterium]|nr:response regulator transcription factor [Acidimicrobiales bacterium]